MLKRPYYMRFLDPDLGGGGGAAVADTPAGDAPTMSEAEVLTALGEFEAPNPGDFVADLSGPNGDKPPVEPKEEPKKPDAVKPPEPKEPVKEPVKDPPAKQLREQLELTKKERDEFKAKLEANPRVKELETSIADVQRERDEFKSRAEEAEKRLSIQHPMANARVRELQQSFDKEYNANIEFVPELASHYPSLVGEFAKLPRGNNEEYSAALNEFEEKLENMVGPRKFASAMDLIRKGHGFIKQRGDLLKEVETDSGRILFEEEEKQWKSRETEVGGWLKEAMQFPEDLETVDPYSPFVFIQRSLAAMEPDKARELESKIDAFIKKERAGQKPRTDKEFIGLPPDEIKKRMADERKWYEEARKASVTAQKQSLLTLAFVRPLLQELSKLNAIVEKRSQSAPPDPNTPGGQKPSDGESLANYRPPLDELDRL